MIIPWVRIEWISDYKGYGLITTQDIPKGTITFVQDGLDIVIPSENVSNVPPNLLEHVYKYSYEDYLGNLIISWDLAKYMNHDDEANTLTTGYGFEIAIRDIKKGEELTDDYRIFSTHHDTSFSTTKKELETFRPWSDELIQSWDDKVLLALQNESQVPQPLKELLSPEVIEQLRLKEFNTKYQSVKGSLPLRYNQNLEHLKY